MEIRTSVFRYKEYAKLIERGFYASISLKTTLREESDARIDLKFNTGELYSKEWQGSIRFAVSYFSSFLIEQSIKSNLYVEINNIGWRPVDTSHTIMVYVTLMALNNAYDLEMKGLSFNKDTGALNLPSF